MNKIKISLIASIVLVLSSFMPVIQVVILTLNGLFISLFTSVNNQLILSINGIGSMIMFLLFYYSKSITNKVLSLFGILFFFIPFLSYVTEKIITTEKFYFLQFIVIGIILSILLVMIEHISNKAHN